MQIRLITLYHCAYEVVGFAEDKSLFAIKGFATNLTLLTSVQLTPVTGFASVACSEGFSKKLRSHNSQTCVI